MKSNQQQPNSEDLGELHQMEIDLILTLRHEFPFGKVEIEMRDGLPQYLLKTVNRRKLGNFKVVHNVDLTKRYPELYNNISK
jgi:hypothetical protein